MNAAAGLTRRRSVPLAVPGRSASARRDRDAGGSVNRVKASEQSNEDAAHHHEDAYQHSGCCEHRINRVSPSDAGTLNRSIRVGSTFLLRRLINDKCNGHE